MRLGQPRTDATSARPMATRSVLDDVSLTHRAARVHRLPGPVGQRQVDPAADHRRARDRRQRRGACWTGGGSTAAAGRARRRHGVPALCALPAHERAREHGVRAAQRAGAEGRDRRAGSPTRRGCWRSSASSTRSRGRCRAASASASRSAARSSSSPSCSCSTSRSPTSTRRCGCAPGSSSRSCASGSRRR